MRLEYEEHTTEILHDFIHPFNILSEVIIGDLETIMYVDGRSFVIDIDQWQYFHMLQDKFGQFEMVYRYFKDVNLVIISERPYGPDSPGYNVTSDLLKIYGYEVEDIICLQDISVKFEEIIYYHVSASELLNRLPGRTTPWLRENDDFFAVNFREAVLLRGALLEHIPEADTPRKIYLSRKGRNDKVANLKHILETSTDEVAQKWAYDNEIVDDPNTNIAWLEMLVKERYFPELEDTLEKELVKAGYSVIHTDGMGLIEQATLCRNATHIAAVNGTGCYNMLFGNEDTKFFIFNLSNFYGWYYEDIVEWIFKKDNLYLLPQRHPNNYIMSKDISFLVNEYLSGIV